MHVHLDDRELLEILLVELVEGVDGHLERGAVFRRLHRCAARAHLDERHLTEAVAAIEEGETLGLIHPGLQDRDLALLEDEHGRALVVFPEEVVVLVNAHLLGSLEQKIQRVVPYRPEDRHCLEQLQ
jgi:hypothetical protein